MSVLIDGMYVPLTTPFYGDGRSYLRKLEHNVGRYSLTPAAGMVALASEGATLSDEEIRQALQIVGATAAAEKVLVAAIAKSSVRGALAIVEEAEKAGFDAVLLSAPSGLSHDETMVFFRAVADASPLPVLLGGGLDVDAIAELAEHVNTIGIFEDGLTIERYRAIAETTAQVKHDVTVTPVFAPVTRRMKAPATAEGSATFVTAESLAGGAALAVAPPKPAMKTRTKTVGFQVMASGGVAGMVELLEGGVAGVMPLLAACAPQVCHEVYAAFKDGDTPLAREKEQRLLAADALMRELGVAGIKYGCDLNGYYGGAPRLPRLPLTAESRARVEKVLAGLKN